MVVAIHSEGKVSPLPHTNHTLELIAITVLGGTLGLFPNFEGGAYVEHDSLESLNPHFVNICFNRDVRLHRSFHGPVAIQVLLGGGEGEG